MRILVVEDDISLNRLICEKLKKDHYSVDSCHLGNEALPYIDGAEYDLIILDIMLPNMDGLEILSALRKKNNLTPVLLLTAKDSIDDKVKGLDLGADDYLSLLKNYPPVSGFSSAEIQSKPNIFIKSRTLFLTTRLKQSHAKILPFPYPQKNIRFFSICCCTKGRFYPVTR